MGRLADWAGDYRSAGVRRVLQIALGVTWLLDAALQYQPYMFGRGFITQVLAPASAGNPAVIARPAIAAAWLIGHDTAVWNALFATAQLALGAGLLWRRTVRAALAGTIVWSLMVWWLGEGLGGLLAANASPLSGAPGAAVLYALLAVLVWPARTDPGQSVADSNPAGRGPARLAWLLLWGSSAYLVLRSASMPEAAFLAALFAVIGAGILFRGTVRPVLILAVISALVIWIAGENFGGVFTGQGTDPNTGPLLILLAVAFWPRHGARRLGIEAEHHQDGRRRVLISAGSAP